MLFWGFRKRKNGENWIARKTERKKDAQALLFSVRWDCGVLKKHSNEMNVLGSCLCAFELCIILSLSDFSCTLPPHSLNSLFRNRNNASESEWIWSTNVRMWSIEETFEVEFRQFHLILLTKLWHCTKRGHSAFGNVVYL